MLLIIISILNGIMGIILGTALVSDAGRDLILAMGMIGFFSPGLYVLSKLYHESDNKKQ